MKWTDRVIDASLMRLEHHEMNQIAKDCFTSILRYMGDLPLLKGQRDVDCALTILSLCYKFDDIKDEVFCQVMKQTTSLLVSLFICPLGSTRRLGFGLTTFWTCPCFCLSCALSCPFASLLLSLAFRS